MSWHIKIVGTPAAVKNHVLNTSAAQTIPEAIKALVAKVCDDTAANNELNKSRPGYIQNQGVRLETYGHLNDGSNQSACSSVGKFECEFVQLAEEPKALDQGSVAGSDS